MSVSFTDGDGSEFEGTHMCAESPAGKVYIPLSGVILDDEPGIRYEKHPWLEGFELDGISAEPVCCAWQPPADSDHQSI